MAGITTMKRRRRTQSLNTLDVRPCLCSSHCLDDNAGGAFVQVGSACVAMYLSVNGNRETSTTLLRRGTVAGAY